MAENWRQNLKQRLWKNAAYDFTFHSFLSLMSSFLYPFFYYYICLFIYLFVFLNRVSLWWVSLWSPGCPKTCILDQTGLESEICLSLLGLDYFTIGRGTTCPGVAPSPPTSVNTKKTPHILPTVQFWGQQWLFQQACVFLTKMGLSMKHAVLSDTYQRFPSCSCYTFNSTQYTLKSSSHDCVRPTPAMVPLEFWQSSARSALWLVIFTVISG